MSFIERSEVALAHVSAEQGGVFARHQALAAGMTRHHIGQCVGAGMWDAVLPNVYRFAGAPDTEDSRCWAAFLWAGDGAAVSHRSAARLWELDVVPAKLPEVTVPVRRAPRCREVTVHRTASLEGPDLRFRAGRRLTSPARTVIDLAAVLDAEDLEVVFESARSLRLVTPDAVSSRLRELGGTGRAGSRTLAAMLADAEGQAPAESRLEVKVARLLRASSLPAPLRQFEVSVAGRWYRLDFAWPARRIALEVDGLRRHASRAAFERDRARWTTLAAAGWRVLVVTWPEVTKHPQTVLARVAGALAAAA